MDSSSLMVILQIGSYAILGLGGLYIKRLNDHLDVMDSRILEVERTMLNRIEHTKEHEIAALQVNERFRRDEERLDYLSNNVPTKEEFRSLEGRVIRYGETIAELAAVSKMSLEKTSRIEALLEKR